MGERSEPKVAAPRRPHRGRVGPRLAPAPSLGQGAGARGGRARSTGPCSRQRTATDRDGMYHAAEHATHETATPQRDLSRGDGRHEHPTLYGADDLGGTTRRRETQERSSEPPEERAEPPIAAEEHATRRNPP